MLNPTTLYHLVEKKKFLYKMISIVSVYNNKKILNDYLLKSLKSQSVDYELITLDNTKGRFKSAAEALNYGREKAKGEYIMFVHQDVDLCSNIWLEKAEKMLDDLPNLGIAGVAGMSERGKNTKERGKNIIKHGIPAVTWPWGNPIQEPALVQTLDECLIIIPQSVFDVLKFDEQVCDDWHLYAVDYCLCAIKMGLGAYAIPLSIYHRATGSLHRKDYFRIFLEGPLPAGYYRTLKKLLKKHKTYFKHIYTTTGNWNTLYPLTLQKYWSLAKLGVGRMALKMGLFKI